MSALHQPVADLKSNQILIAELRNSRDRFLAILATVPERLKDVHPDGAAWSIMECAEHVCVAEQLMFGALQKRRPTDATPVLERDALIRNVALDRSRSLSAPEQARPTGQYRSLPEAAQAFRDSREKTIAFIESLDEDLRKSTSLHPLGIFDSYQFVMIMALHPERHAMQIEEIKNCAAYRAAIQA